MAVLINSDKGRNYAKNVLSPVLNFVSGTWTVSAGTGTATRFKNVVFSGEQSLKLENTDPVNDLIVSNTNQDSVIKDTGNYQLSWYCLKADALEPISGKVMVYKNAAFLDTQTFTLGSADADLDIDEKWQRFQSDTEYSLLADDVITFQFVINGSATVKPNISLWFDGIMLNKANRQNITAPLYNPPFTDLETLTALKNEKGFGFYVDSLTTPTIVVGTSWTELTIDGLGSSVTGFLPLEIRGVSELVNASGIQPISSGDDYDGRLDITVDSQSGSPNYMEVIIDFAGAAPDTLRAFTGYIQEAKSPPFKQSLTLDFFTGDTFLANKGKFYARTDAGSYTISTRNVKISRKSKNLG